MRVRGLIAVLSIGLSLGTLSGCGQAEPDPTPAATAASKPPSAGAPDPAAPAPTTADVPDESRLRTRPEWRAVQQWAAAYAEIVNAGDGTQSAAKNAMTREGLERMRFYTQQDWGRYFPGPLPITVTKIGKPSGDGVTWVQACAWMRGWSQASATDPQRDEREITPVKLGLKRKGDDWLVDGMSNGKAGTCDGVRVEGRADGQAG